MRNTSLLICVMLSLQAAPALAQSGPASRADNNAAAIGAVTSGRSDEPPGWLSAHDVIGKRLMDSDGNVIGHIEKLSADGRSVVVRGPHGGRPVLVAMDELSLGMGAHTVIDEHNSSAKALNQRSVAQDRREETTTTTTIPVPTVGVTTTTYSESSTRSTP